MVALRGEWVMMLRPWLGWTWQRATSKACCLFPKHSPYRAGKGQPSLPLGCGGPGAGCCTADLWGRPEPVMLDMGSPRRRRRGGARDTHSVADTWGGRWPLVPASRAPPVSGRYFPRRTFSSPGWRSRCYLLKSREVRGCPATVPHLPLPGLAFQPPVPSEKRESSPQPGEVSQGAARWEKPPLQPRSPCPLLAPRVASLSLSSVPPGRIPRAEELRARGFPTEEPEQFGKAVTSLRPGENGM